MGLGHLAVLVDDVRDALRVLVFRRGGRAVGQADLAVGVAEQREVELELVGEAAVGVDVVEADAEDLDVLGRVLVVKVPEPGTLGRSAGCVGLRIEPEDDFAAAVVAQLPVAAGVIDDFEIRGGVTGVEHRSSSSKDVSQHSCQGHGDVLYPSVSPSPTPRQAAAFLTRLGAPSWPRPALN